MGEAAALRAEAASKRRMADLARMAGRLMPKGEEQEMMLQHAQDLEAERTTSMRMPTLWGPIAPTRTLHRRTRMAKARR
jgi:hypothetical protein